MPAFPRPPGTRGLNSDWRQTASVAAGLDTLDVAGRNQFRIPKIEFYIGETQLCNHPEGRLMAMHPKPVYASRGDGQVHAIQFANIFRRGES